jgi:hypothetical protein
MRRVATSLLVSSFAQVSIQPIAGLGRAKERANDGNHHFDTRLGPSSG